MTGDDLINDWEALSQYADQALNALPNELSKKECLLVLIMACIAIILTMLGMKDIDESTC